jgi:hypothetical protein
VCTHYRVASDSDVFYSSATWSHSLLQTPPPRWRPCLTHPTPHPLAPTRLARRFLQLLMQRLNLRAFRVPRPGAHASPALTCPAYSACDSRQTWTCRGSARSSWRCTEHAVQASAPDRSLAEILHERSKLSSPAPAAHVLASREQCGPGTFLLSGFSAAVSRPPPTASFLLCDL